MLLKILHPNLDKGQAERLFQAQDNGQWYCIEKHNISFPCQRTSWPQSPTTWAMAWRTRLCYDPAEEFLDQAITPQHTFDYSSLLVKERKAGLKPECRHWGQQGLRWKGPRLPQTRTCSGPGRSGRGSCSAHIWRHRCRKARCSCLKSIGSSLVSFIFVCGHRPKTKEFLELLFLVFLFFLLLFTFWFISSLKGI